MPMVPPAPASAAKARIASRLVVWMCTVGTVWASATSVVLVGLTSTMPTPPARLTSALAARRPAAVLTPRSQTTMRPAASALSRLLARQVVALAAWPAAGMAVPSTRAAVGAAAKLLE